MTVSITTQPETSRALVGELHTFAVSATGTEPLTYEWFVEGVSQGVVSDRLFYYEARADNSFHRIYVVVGDDDNTFESSETVVAISQTDTPNMQRHALVWNYDDNNFTWKDPAIEVGDELYDVTWSTYGFSPGFQGRWSDYQSGGINESTWEQARVANIRWSDTYSEGESKEVLQISTGQLWKADKVINAQDSLKRYYATRTQIDMDDLVPEWTTNKIKYIKQFVFHMQADQKDIPEDRDNTVDFSVGWAQNLMEEPNWQDAREIILEDRASGGKYKVDYRTSGRYLSLSFDFTNSTQLALTGGDIDAQETHGR